SGTATASGLQIANVVNMAADASVDIDGNNYAPIFIHIAFNTTIDNRGLATASSGNVASGAQSSSSSATNTSGANNASRSGHSATSGSVGPASTAIGGNATALSNSVQSKMTSAQVSSANGSDSIAPASLTQMLNNLPTGSWDRFVQPNLPV